MHICMKEKLNGEASKGLLISQYSYMSPEVV